MSDAGIKALEKELKKVNNKANKALTSGVLMTDALAANFKGQMTKTKTFKPRNKKTTRRYVNILLSDLHYGADLDGDEAPLLYGTNEERRRTAAVTREIVEYKEQYRDHTELVVHLAGDIIQGRLHDAASAAPIAEQCTRAIHLLGALLRHGVEHFPSVQVNCTPGNHGRNKQRHPDRAVEQKWDSFENIIYEALRLMFTGVPNIKFNIPKTPFYEYSLFGMKGFITHGDTVLNPGYPGKAINVSRLEQQILKLFSARGHYSLVGCGHVHVPSATHLSSTVLLTNGCLIPPDPYSLSIGLHSNICVQQLWETVPGYMFGDHRMINVDSKTDADRTLDDVIAPDRK